MHDTMESTLTSGYARRAILAGAVAVAAVPAVVRAHDAPVEGPEEKRAIALVKAWAEALVAKDVDKVVSFMDEACQYRDDPFQTDLKKGIVRLREDVKMLLRGLTGIKIETICAVGSAKNDVLVLVRRVDQFSLGGKIVSMPMGGYYRVRNGKILEWLDTPLAEMPPPPAGSGFPGAPHPGA